ncbi:Slp family lipoprotein [Photobacterium aquimaris]|uniref:Outer membrane protein slp n=1 Tax=Photobacterium aquimaris TaxID=512643 RepID=A0A1Y6KSL8_9GAMM|nr:Slp family lipoprotein [Photobacterium aquimaris]SMY15044.1 Outer membrane protein slp precursor [Photobacterium aquimaris]
MFSKLFLGVILVFMVGCASLPATLVTKSKDPITDLSVIQQHPQASQNKEVRLGGVIASIRNEQLQTRIEMVAMPLTSDGRPILNAQSKGRFIAYINGFLEPLEYAKGRLLTVVGKFSGDEQGKIGKYPYTFPVVQVFGQQLWRVQQQIQLDDPFWTRQPCYSFNCDPWDNDLMMPNFGINGRIVERVVP